MVILRLDAVLKDKKDEVLKKKKKLEDAGVVSLTSSLYNAAKQVFYNGSPFRLHNLASKTKLQQLKTDFAAYLDGFSPNVQEVLEKFKLRNLFDTLLQIFFLYLCFIYGKQYKLREVSTNVEKIGIGAIVVTALFSVISAFVSFHFARISSLRSLDNQFIEYMLSIDSIVINNPELAYLYDDNEELEKRLEKAEYFNKMTAFIILHFNMYENIYFQVLQRKIFKEKDSIESWENFFIDLFEINLVNEIWETMKRLYNKDFAVYVDKLLKENTPRKEELRKNRIRRAELRKKSVKEMRITSA